ncbi:hypothetical protein MLD38_000964 [Melastoma candidum]|uniref:Uncharacterized protein n=1 Tax=Melastoma candidum TaxID=119954 RepID=A0ACB9SFP4_9MYRT|nr:hypothetical protein MLD38_000964 [Melastoma candidum]
MRTKSRRLIRFLTIPSRALARARDLYVHTMCAYADRIGHAASGCSVSSCPPPPGRFSVSSSGRDEIDCIEELVRSASATSKGFVCLDEQRKKGMPGPGQSRVVPSRSCRSVAMERIDEECPCKFQDSPAENGGRKPVVLYYPRSRSHGLAASHENKFIKS